MTPSCEINFLGKNDNPLNNNPRRTCKEMNDGNQVQTHCSRCCYVHLISWWELSTNVPVLSWCWTAGEQHVYVFDLFALFFHIKTVRIVTILLLSYYINLASHNILEPAGHVIPQRDPFNLPAKYKAPWYSYNQDYFWNVGKQEVTLQTGWPL